MVNLTYILTFILKSIIKYFSKTYITFICVRKWSI